MSVRPPRLRAGDVAAVIATIGGDDAVGQWLPGLGDHR